MLETDWSSSPTEPTGTQEAGRDTTDTTGEPGTNSVSVKIVLSKDLPAHQERLATLLDETRAEWEYYHLAADMMEMLMDSRNILLCIENGEAYFLLKTIIYKTGRISLCSVWSNGTQLVQYAEAVLQMLEKLGKIFGADRIEMAGRPAVAKILGKHGVIEESRNFVRVL